MSMRPINVPVSFFGMVLGLVGLGDCWRVATLAWGMPAQIAHGIMLLSFALWAVLTVFYIGKWLLNRAEALAEWHDPLQGCFVGLAAVATLLAGIAIAPLHQSLAFVLFVVGSTSQLAYAVYFTGRLWRGERAVGTVSAALYLPTVAGNFVSAFCAGYLGHPDVGVLFLGAGFASWLSLESVITHRLAHHATLPAPMRPTLGIMLAPPAVGCVGYLFVTGGLAGGPVDLFAQLLLGYALLQLAFLVGLLPWITRQPFTASYWAFSFGVTALAFDSIVFVLRGQKGFMEWLSLGLFGVANLVIATLVVLTLWRLLTGKLLPPPILQPN